MRVYCIIAVGLKSKVSVSKLSLIEIMTLPLRLCVLPFKPFSCAPFKTLTACTLNAIGESLLKSLESLSTGTFLHDGGLFSVSGLNREWRFLARIFNLGSARITTMEKRKRKLTLKSPVVNKNLEQKSVLK